MTPKLRLSFLGAVGITLDGEEAGRDIQVPGSSTPLWL
jgi:hypothetical protein